MYCDRVVVMSSSKLLLNGTPGEVFSKHQLLKEHGLDVPEITNIVLKLNEIGVDISTDIYTVEDAVNALIKAASHGKKEANDVI